MGHTGSLTQGEGACLALGVCLAACARVGTTPEGDMSPGGTFLLWQGGGLRVIGTPGCFFFPCSTLTNLLCCQHNLG